MQRVDGLRGSNVSVTTIGEFDACGRAYPLLSMQFGREAPGKTRVLLASGIHGDEPGGVEAALRFIEENSENQSLLDRFIFTVFPCNNPSGYELDSRENWRGVDLNREFGARSPEPEAKIVMDALQGRCFDLVYEMHEDINAPGFYLYEIAEDAAYQVGEHILAAIANMGYPVNLDECIEGMPATGGLIRRKSFKFRKTRVPQAIYMYRTCGGHVITMEPPVSMLALDDRVKILLTGLRIALGDPA